MKFSALLSILVLAAALGLMVMGKTATLSVSESSPQSSSAVNVSGADVDDNPEASSPPDAMDSSAKREIRYLGHDWIEVVDPVPPSSSPFAPAAGMSNSWIHPAHRSASPCRVCELVRVMNEAW